MKWVHDIFRAARISQEVFQVGKMMGYGIRAAIQNAGEHSHRFEKPGRADWVFKMKNTLIESIMS